MAPSIVLDERTLESYFRWIERETGWTLRYSDPSLASRAATTQVHADVEGLTPAETLDVVLPACGVRHRVQNGILVVEPLF